MTFLETYLAEFDRETATTRKYLERVPEDKGDWKPHAKSMSLAQLAKHIATLPGYAHIVLTRDSLDAATAPKPPEIAHTRAALLAAFDAKVAEARAAIVAAKPESLDKTWELSMGGKKAFALPRALALRFFALNHLIHHRGQFGVYLRLNGVPLPSTYGPSADEMPPAIG